MARLKAPTQIGGIPIDPRSPAVGNALVWNGTAFVPDDVEATVPGGPFLPLSGGTLTGALLLHESPSAGKPDLQAATWRNLIDAYNTIDELANNVDSEIALLPRGFLGWATKVANQTGIGTTEVDISGQSTTIVTAGNRYLKISFQAAALPSTNDNTLQVLMKEDNTTVWTYDFTLGRSNASDAIGGFNVRTPGAGSHTYKLSALMSVGTGTVTWVASAGRRSTLLVEDIGPVP